MIVLIFFLLFAFAALAFLLYLFLRQQRPNSTGEFPQTFTVESFFDLNARHFAQIKQALSESDFRYLQTRGPASLARRLRHERREILVNYVCGLKEDFDNLLHLRQVLARLDAAVVRQHEPEVFRLRVAFYLLFALVQVKLALSWLTRVPAPTDLEPLVVVVNRMAQATEAALNGLAEAQARQLHAELT